MKRLVAFVSLGSLLLHHCGLAVADGTETANGKRADSATTQATVKAFQSQLVFPGARSQGHSGGRVYPPAGCALATLHGPDGTKIVALFGREIGSPNNILRPTLLFFYGNGMCMADSLSEFNEFRRLGFNVITVDYEGYGMSDGSPSEQGCYAADNAAYDYLLTRNDVDKSRIVATGWSLGAVVAIDLASRKHLTGLATFSAFTNISDMTQALAPGHIAVDLGCQFDNLAKIGSVSCPIFMAHGTEDPLVPPAMLDRLARAAKTKVMVVRVNLAGHNEIFRVGGDLLYQQLGAFVNGLPSSSATTWGG